MLIFNSSICRAKTEIRIKDGEQGNAKKVNNPEKWALNIFEKTIPNFS